MPYFCPNCQCPITESTGSSGDTTYACSDCRSGWKREELQEEDTLPTGTRLGNFEIRRALGVGGMGQVYLARQVSLDRDVALKVLPKDLARDEKALKRFLQEVRHTASLEHRSIITVFEAGTEQGVSFLAMDYVDGASLDRMLKRNNAPFAELEALRIVRETADALRHAWNRRQILHRDIKPANIMLDSGGRVRLLDLGIAKRTAERSADRSSLTQRGMAIGTPHYMSPEQARGEANIDSRSDQYALGTTLYHILTNKRPFEGSSVVDILAKQINREPEPIRQVNPEIAATTARVVARMMAKKREDRYESWEALIAELDRLRSGEPILEVGNQPHLPGRHGRDSSFHAGEGGGRSSGWRVTALVLLLLLVSTLAYLNYALPRRSAPGTVAQSPPPVAAPVTAPPKADPVPAVGAGPEQVPEFTPEELVMQAVAAGRSPIEVADRLEKENPEGLVLALAAIIERAPGADGKWARAAATRLEAHYRRQGDKLGVERVLLARLQPVNPADHVLPEDFIRAADWYREVGRGKDAERLLWGGIRQGAADSAVATACAQALCDRFNEAGDRSQILLVLHTVLAALPIDSPDRAAFEARQKELAGDSAPPEPVAAAPEDRAIVDLRALIEQTPAGPAQRKLKRRLAQLLQGAGRFAEAVSLLRTIIQEVADSAEAADIGHDLARCHLAAGEQAARLEILAKLAELPARAELIPHATLACRMLADYYDKQDNPFLRNRYLTDIADRYGALAPLSAAEALFQVAAWHEKKGRARSALDIVQRIHTDFAKAGPDTMARANREIERLNAANPELSGRPAASTDLRAGAPEDAIVIDGTGHFVRMNRAVSTISSAHSVTISLWVQILPQLPSSRSLVSRLNPSNNRGFQLSQEYDGSLSFTVGNAARVATAHTTDRLPENTWTHIAAVADKGRLEIYVNGKLAGQGTYPNEIELDGAGRLHVGRNSWNDNGGIRAWFRYVTVYPERIYTGPFTPAETPPDFAKAAVCLTVRAGRVGDLRRNPVDSQ